MRFKVDDMHRGRNRRENKKTSHQKTIEKVHLRSQTWLTGSRTRSRSAKVKTSNCNTTLYYPQVGFKRTTLLRKRISPRDERRDQVEHVRRHSSGGSSRNFHAHPFRERFGIVARGSAWRGARESKNGPTFETWRNTRRGRGFFQGANVASTRIIREHVFGGDCESVATPSASG